MTEIDSVASGLRETPIAELHRRLGATMVCEHGVVMPYAYSDGGMMEHGAVRRACGVFDVSHLGRFEVHGPGAIAFVDTVTTNDVQRLGIGRAQYSLLLTHLGTILDDCLVYRLVDHVMLVVTAPNRIEDLAHIMRLAPMFDCRVTDVTAITGQLAVQGPRAEVVLQALTATALQRLPLFGCVEGMVAGVPALIARTGYTGEDGFELYVQAGDLGRLWLALVTGAQPVVPAGLAARDTLRLEAGLVRAHGEIDQTRTPDEAGLTRVVKIAKGEFVGRDALVERRRRGYERRLIGISTLLPDVPAPGAPVFVGGEPSGVVLSAAVSPTLGVPLATCYVPRTAPGGWHRAVTVEIDGRHVLAALVELPFYTRRAGR